MTLSIHPPPGFSLVLRNCRLPFSHICHFLNPCSRRPTLYQMLWIICNWPNPVPHQPSIPPLWDNVSRRLSLSPSWASFSLWLPSPWPCCFSFLYNHSHHCFLVIERLQATRQTAPTYHLQIWKLITCLIKNEHLSLPWPVADPPSRRESHPFTPPRGPFSKN